MTKEQILSKCTTWTEAEKKIINDAFDIPARMGRKPVLFDGCTTLAQIRNVIDIKLAQKAKKALNKEKNKIIKAEDAERILNQAETMIKDLNLTVEDIINVLTEKGVELYNAKIDEEIAALLARKK